MEIAIPAGALVLLITMIGALMGIAAWLRCGTLDRRLRELERLGAVPPADLVGRTRPR